MPGIQEGGPDWCSPVGMWPVSAPSHAKVKLLWKSADECCWLRTCLFQYHLILTTSYCDKKANWPSCSHTCKASQRLWLVGEETACNRRSRTLVGSSHLASSDLYQASTCLPGLDQWRDSEGCFLEDMDKRIFWGSDKSTETDDVPWRKCDWRSVKILQMDKAL